MKSFFLIPTLSGGFLVVSLSVSLAQWQPDIRLTNAMYSSYTAFNGRSIATDITKVHVVWEDFRDAQITGGEGSNIYYKRSTNNGGNWSSDIKIVNDPYNSFRPNIGVYQNNLHVVWFDDRHGYREIYYKRSTDDGLTWGPDVRLTNAAEDSEDPTLYVIGTSIHVVWSDWRDHDWEVYYKRSTNNGASWTSDIRLTAANGLSEHPHIVTTSDGQTIHVVWQDNRDGNYEMYYKRSTNGGVNWGSDTRLTYSGGYSRFPSLAISGTTLHLFWTDSRTRIDAVYYKKSTDNGISWNSDVRLVNANSAVPSACLSNDGQIVHLVWMDFRDDYPNGEIYYKKSLDGGATWGPDTRLTDSPAVSEVPSIAIAFQTVHVVWDDERDGNFEIYYKRDVTGNTLPVQLASFTGTVIGNNRVRLDWMTISEINNYGFYVQRRNARVQEWTEIPNSFVPGHGTTNEPHYYSFTDPTPITTVTQYRLRQVDLDGTIHYSDPIQVALPTGAPEVEVAPREFALEQNYPNPFNPSTKIAFSIPVGTGHAPSLLKVYDVLGREVATLVNENLQPGSYEVTFDASGLPSGVYFYRLTAGNFAQTKKLLLVR